MKNFVMNSGETCKRAVSNYLNLNVISLFPPVLHILASLQHTQAWSSQDSYCSAQAQGDEGVHDPYQLCCQLHPVRHGGQRGGWHPWSLFFFDALLELSNAFN